jgi:hypothetical protein
MRMNACGPDEHHEQLRTELTPAVVRARPTRWFRRSLLACLAGTGLLGITALLFGSFGDLQTRTLLTTLLVGLYSVLCLGNLLSVGTGHSWVGRVGIGASTVALVVALARTWGITGDDHHLGREFQAFAVCAVVGFALMHTALLLHVSGPAGTLTRATLVAVAAVAAILCALIAEVPHDVPGTWRLLGVAAILDVVGTVFVAALGRSGRQAR